MNAANRNQNSVRNSAQPNPDVVVAPSNLQARIAANRAQTSQREAQQEEEKLNLSLNGASMRGTEVERDLEDRLINAPGEIDLGGESSSLLEDNNQNKYNYGNKPAESTVQGAKKKAPVAKADDVRAARLALLGGGPAAAPKASTAQKSCPVCTFKNAADATVCEMCNSAI